MTKQTKNKRIALVGATGLVGQEFMRQLDSLKDIEKILLIASEDSKGELLQVAGKECEVTTLHEDSFKDIDLIFLAAPKEVCERALRYAAAAKVMVVDATQTQQNPSNTHSASDSHVVLPDPITTLIYPVMQALALQGAKSISVSTYQAVSGAGRAGVDELWNQTLGVFNQTETESEAFEQQISFNCIPQIDIMNEQGMSRMELRVSKEISQKIPDSKATITVTGVRVPTLFGISASITAVVSDFNKESFEKKVSSFENVDYHTDVAEVITPLQVVGDNKIHVARLRANKEMVSVWVTSDNIQTCLVGEGMKYLD